MAEPHLFEPPTPVVQEQPPEKIYRFFNEPDHAIDLAAGKVWISTLGFCRNCERTGQGDIGEATHNFVIGRAWHGNSSDPQFAKAFDRLGIYADEFSSGTLENTRKIEMIPDAYVICTSEICDRSVLGSTFGIHGVEISKPIEFLRLIDAALKKVARVESGTIGRIRYKSRTVPGASDPPGLLGYVKPPEGYAHQREVRLLWKALSLPPIKSFLLDVPECAGLCRILPL